MVYGHGQTRQVYLQFTTARRIVAFQTAKRQVKPRRLQRDLVHVAAAARPHRVRRLTHVIVAAIVRRQNQTILRPC